MAAVAQIRSKATGFVAKRGRPDATQLAAIEESILTVACSMFLENGYANTSMDAVASTSGVSKGTLYARYADKTELFNAVVSDRLSVWSKTSLDSTLSHNGTLPDFLFRFAVAFLRGMRDPEAAAFHRLLNAEAGRFPELAQQFYRQGYQTTVTRIAAELETLSATTGSQIVDARGLVVAFNSALLGWYHAEALRRDVSDDECMSYASRLTGIFIGARAVW